MRRDTSSELKDNKQYLDKLKGELHICSSFAKDLNRKSEDLYQECLTAMKTTCTYLWNMLHKAIWLH